MADMVSTPSTHYSISHRIHRMHRTLGRRKKKKKPSSEDFSPWKLERERGKPDEAEVRFERLFLRLSRRNNGRHERKCTSILLPFPGSLVSKGRQLQFIITYILISQSQIALFVHQGWNVAFSDLEPGWIVPTGQLALLYMKLPATASNNLSRAPLVQH